MGKPLLEVKGIKRVNNFLLLVFINVSHINFLFSQTGPKKPLLPNFRHVQTLNFSCAETNANEKIYRSPSFALDSTYEL